MYPLCHKHPTGLGAHLHLRSGRLARGLEGAVCAAAARGAPWPRHPRRGQHRQAQAPAAAAQERGGYGQQHVQVLVKTLTTPAIHHAACTPLTDPACSPPELTVCRRQPAQVQPLLMQILGCLPVARQLAGATTGALVDTTLWPPCDGDVRKTTPPQVHP